MNNNKTKQNGYMDAEKSDTENSTTQKYINSLLRQPAPLLEGTDDKPKHATPTCHSILQRKSVPDRPQHQTLQRKSLPARPQHLLQVGENKYKNPPPPPPLNIKNRFGSTTEMQTDNVFRSQAEDIARELNIVRKIQNISTEPEYDPYLRSEPNERFRYDYYEEDNDLENETMDYSNGSSRKSSREYEEEFEQTLEEPIYNVGEKFKIARPILARTTSVGRLVNNFESLEETRSLAGDVRPRSPPITNSQRRFGTLTRQRTHLGIGIEYGAMPSEYQDEDHYLNMNSIAGNGNNEYPDNEEDGWGATRHRTGPTTGKFRGPTNIWNTKFFVPPNQPKPPLPPPPACLSPKSSNPLQHSVRFFFHRRMYI